MTAYPEAQKFLDYEAMELKPFFNGAMVWYNGTFYKVADPFRHPIAGAASVLNPIGSVEDKLRVGLLRLTLAAKSDSQILSEDETTTMEHLKVRAAVMGRLNLEWGVGGFVIFSVDDRSLLPAVLWRHLLRQRPQSDVTSV